MRTLVGYPEPDEPADRRSDDTVTFDGSLGEPGWSGAESTTCPEQRAGAAARPIRSARHPSAPAHSSSCSTDAGRFLARTASLESLPTSLPHHGPQDEW